MTRSPLLPDTPARWLRALTFWPRAGPASAHDLSPNTFDRRIYRDCEGVTAAAPSRGGRGGSAVGAGPLPSVASKAGGCAHETGTRMAVFFPCPGPQHRYTR